MINLNASPWLSRAIEFIRRNPGVNKSQVVYAFASPNRWVHVPNRTAAYRFARLTDAIHEGLIENRSVTGYSLFVSE